MIRMYWTILLIIMIGSCKSLNREQTDLIIEYFVFQTKVSENGYYKGYLILRDGIFTMKLLKSGSDIGYNVERFSGNYVIENDFLVMSPFDCTDSLEVTLSKESFYKIPRLKIIFHDNTGIEQDLGIITGRSSFSGQFGQLYYQLDSAEWNLIPIGNNFEHTLRTDTLVGENIRFKFSYSDSLFGVNDHDCEPFYSELFLLSDLSQSDVNIRYNLYQIGCLDSIVPNGVVGREGIEIKFNEIIGFEGLYRRTNYIPSLL
jgi:hypothetical protein